MTTQACNLIGRIPGVPVYVQRIDGTAYFETDADVVRRMIEAEVVEGRGPRSGVIARLYILCSEAEALERMRAKEQKPEESAGSITSQASREIYREKLEDGVHWCWNFKQNRTLFA